MTNLKRVFLVMVIVILLGATTVFATTDGTIIITEDDTTPTNTAQPTTPDDTASGSTVIDSGNVSAYQNTTLPQTGANDYAMVVIIAVFGVSAVYAYKKVSEYKNI